MPTILGKRFSLDWRGSPPYMLDADAPIWYRFLEKFGAPFLNLWHQVRLGGPFLTPEESLDPLKRDWQYLLQKRIDALVELEKEIWIIEVNAQAGQRSIGQLMTYQTLWLRDPKIMKLEKLILVAETMDSDLIDAAGSHGVQIFLV